MLLQLQPLLLSNTGPQLLLGDLPQLRHSFDPNFSQLPFCFRPTPGNSFTESACIYSLTAAPFRAKTPECRVHMPSRHAPQVVRGFAERVASLASNRLCEAPTDALQPVLLRICSRICSAKDSVVCSDDCPVLSLHRCVTST
eukprot:gnl/TRDRNA2_/TRDRNA2_162023_c2_seq2.p2 gnl/TRDRNA2_/TRDRNA2_162023_c2~~gnl/TRDRNA2_/TRDRNA2_162023_c2_seq2.p2  ORF type:complete len:142 (-),score=11.09 gnl/TRDRNA2_/TRDRNA2_162023_c2_seq2:93-518(-)